MITRLCNGSSDSTSESIDRNFVRINGVNTSGILPVVRDTCLHKDSEIREKFEKRFGNWKSILHLNMPVFPHLCRLWGKCCKDVVSNLLSITKETRVKTVSFSVLIAFSYWTRSA